MVMAPFVLGTYRPKNDDNNNNVPEDPNWKDYLQLWSASGNETPDPLPMKQSSWDRSGIEKDRVSIESGLSTPLQRAAFNAARSRHSGDRLLALPITTCGLKLDDESESQLEPGWL